jgi:hypothetical protein
MDQFGLSYFLALNDSVTLQRAVEPGGIVIVQSAFWDTDTTRSGDNISISLLNNTGDYLLQISLRQDDNVIAFNARAVDGEWGAEERKSLQGTFVSPCFNIAICDDGDRYGIFFSYQLNHYFDKRIDGLVSSVSYSINSNQTSPFCDILVLSTYDAMEEMALTNYRACSEIRPVPRLEKSVHPLSEKPSRQLTSNRSVSTSPATTAATFSHGAGPVALPGQKKKDRLGKSSQFGCLQTLLADGQRLRI